MDNFKKEIDDFVGGESDFMQSIFAVCARWCARKTYMNLFIIFKVRKSDILENTSQFSEQFCFNFRTMSNNICIMLIAANSDVFCVFFNGCLVPIKSTSKWSYFPSKVVKDWWIWFLAKVSYLSTLVSFNPLFLPLLLLLLLEQSK